MLCLVIFGCLLASVFVRGSPDGLSVIDLYNKNGISISMDIKSEILMDMLEFVRSYGFYFQEHNVITDDGYELILYNLKNPNVTQTVSKSVFMLHGLFGTCADFVISGVNAPAFKLANDGCNVWLGNARGNYYSRKHIQLNDTCAAFWDFSWHEIGCYDVSAMIDFILNITGTDKLHYIGYSQSGAAIMVLLSTRPEYNNKVKTVTLWAPATYMTNCPNYFLKVLAGIYGITPQCIVGTFVNGLFQPDQTFKDPVAAVECWIYLFNKKKKVFCYDWLTNQLEYTDEVRYPLYQAFSNERSSIKQIVHYIQLMFCDEFRQYNYGVNGNLLRYNSTTPPSYPLNKVTAPVAVFAADNDKLVSITDILKMYSQLINPISLIRINKSTFGHLGFIIDTRSISLVYPQTIAIIKARDP